MAKSVPKREPLLIWVDADLRSVLDRVKDRDGVNLSEQVRRALRSWLAARGIGGARTAPETKGGR